MLKSSSPFTFKYFSRTILSSVNVPVLSVQNMFIAPKFWIESNFLTIVFFFDILTAPLDKLEDKITGNSSGVMQIAIATAKVNARIISCFSTFIKNTIGIIKIIILINNLLILSIPFWNAVFSFPEVTVFAIFPKYVESPTFITTPFAEPDTTFVPIKQILSKSDILSNSSCLFSNSTVFFILSDSPVNEACPTYKSFDSIILKSAGIILPADNKTMSPKVTFLTGIFISLLSLITVVVVSTISLNFSAALLDLYDSKKSNKVLAVTKIAMTIIFA